MLEPKQFISWHEVTIGLWAAILTAIYYLTKFLRWFSTRELEAFWKKISFMQLTHVNTLRKEIEIKFDSLDEKISKIERATHGNRESKDAVLNEVLETLKQIKIKDE